MKKWSRQRRDRCYACGRSVSLRLTAGAAGLILEDKWLFCVQRRGFVYVAAQRCSRTLGVLVLAVCTVGSTGWRMKDPLEIAAHSTHFRISVRTGQSVTKCGRERYNGGDGCIVYCRSVFVCVGSAVRGITPTLLKPRSSCMRDVLFLVVILKCNNCMSWPTPNSCFQTEKNKASPLLPLNLAIKFLWSGNEPNTSKSGSQDTMTSPG